MYLTGGFKIDSRPKFNLSGAGIYTFISGAVSAAVIWRLYSPTRRLGKGEDGESHVNSCERDLVMILSCNQLRRKGKKKSRTRATHETYNYPGQTLPHRANPPHRHFDPQKEWSGGAFLVISFHGVSRWCIGEDLSPTNAKALFEGEKRFWMCNLQHATWGGLGSILYCDSKSQQM